MLEIMTFDVSSKTTKNFGLLKYKTHPKIGEWVEIEIDSIGTMFNVVMVAHSTEGAGSDIYVKRLSKTTDAVSNLHES